MLTTVQAAQVYGVRPATVRDWIRRGKITRNRRGLIDIHDLDRWWDRRDTRMADVASQVRVVPH